MVKGNERWHAPFNRNGYRFWLGLSGAWESWFWYLASVCSPTLKLSKGRWQRQGQSWTQWGPAVTMKIEWIFTTWRNSSWLAAATPLVGPASTADDRHRKTVVPVENYWVILALCMCPCEGGSGANFYLFHYFQEWKGKQVVPKSTKITGI